MSVTSTVERGPSGGSQRQSAEQFAANTFETHFHTFPIELQTRILDVSQENHITLNVAYDLILQEDLDEELNDRARNYRR